MRSRFIGTRAIITSATITLAIITFAISVFPATANSDTTSTRSPEEFKMTLRGTFDVAMTPQDPDSEAAGPIGRLLLTKTYHGDIEATSSGQMLGYRSSVEGSAGYVAMEQVTGTLAGRQGSFVLQHGATMARGETERLIAKVVPDSGTDELAGLSGELEIIIEDGQHRYEFHGALADR